MSRRCIQVIQVTLGTFALTTSLMLCSHADTQPTAVQEPTPQSLRASFAGVETDLDVSDDALNTSLERASARLNDGIHWKTLLRADSDIQDYRLILHVRRKTGEELRSDLAFLFSHSQSPVGFHWVRDPQTTDRSAWLLRRSVVSRQQESALRETLPARSAKWLRELYGAAVLNGKEREQAAARAESPYLKGQQDLGGPVGALAALNRKELEQLIAEGGVWISQDKLPPGLFPHIALGDKGVITFRPSEDEPGTYALLVSTAPVGQGRVLGTIIDPLGVMGGASATSSAHRLDEKPNAPVIDLSAALQKLGPYKEMPLHTRLEHIARSSGANIYCEYFPPTDGRMAAHRLSSKGTVNQLLNEAAKAFRYDVVEHNGDYFLWSRTWFSDRPDIVPGETAGRFRARSAAGLPYLLEDFLASDKLTYGQWRMLRRLESQYGQEFNPPTNLKTLSLLARLTPRQRAIAETPAGISLSALSPELQSEFDRLTKSTRSFSEGNDARIRIKTVMIQPTNSSEKARQYVDVTVTLMAQQYIEPRGSMTIRLR